MTLSYDLAQKMVSRAVEAGRTQGCPIVAVAVDLAGNPVAIARMDGVNAVNTEIARKKALAAAAFRSATHDFVDQVQRDPLAKTVVLAETSINLLPGGFPLHEGDNVVGGLGIAGGFYLQDRAIGEFAVSGK